MLYVGSLDGFLKAYIAKYRYGSVTTEEWKVFFLEFFNKEVSVRDAIISTLHVHVHVYTLYMCMASLHVHPHSFS